MSTLRENLEAVRALIAKGWTRGVFARDSCGLEVSVDSGRATCYCLSGAIWLVGGDAELDTAMTNAIKYQIGDPVMLSEYNDEYDITQADVLALIDRAIEASPPKPSPPTGCSRELGRPGAS